MSHESYSKNELMLPPEYFYSPRGYLWFKLPVAQFESLPDEVVIDGKKFHKKNEFHVTVINGRRFAEEIAKLGNSSVEEVEKEIQSHLARYIREKPLRFGSFHDDYRLAQLDDKESIAARCTLENLDGFFEELRRIYDYPLPSQPAHVSIYTHTPIAVGIDSFEEMESYPKIVLPEVHNILSKIEG